MSKLKNCKNQAHTEGGGMKGLCQIYDAKMVNLLLGDACKCLKMFSLDFLKTFWH